MDFDETKISRAIIEAYSAKLLDCLENDVLIAGAGPSGLTAAFYLASSGLKTTVVEKRLSPGGGVWGGGMMMDEVVIQRAAKSILDDLEIKPAVTKEGLLVVPAAELACAVCLKAIRAGARMFNLTAVEDVDVHQQRVTGLVVNRTTCLGVLPIDPIVLKARVSIDATGHEAAVVSAVQKHGLPLSTPSGKMEGEWAMDAPSGENFVVEKAAEVFPGLYVMGMATCATFGGPRMGPIFGGMLLSGKKIAEIIAGKLAAKK